MQDFRKTESKLYELVLPRRPKYKRVGAAFIFSGEARHFGLPEKMSVNAFVI